MESKRAITHRFVCVCVCGVCVYDLATNRKQFSSAIVRGPGEGRVPGLQESAYEIFKLVYYVVQFSFFLFRLNSFYHITFGIRLFFLFIYTFVAAVPAFHGIHAWHAV